jgi:hypothetical protein
MLLVQSRIRVCRASAPEICAMRSMIVRTILAVFAFATDSKKGRICSSSSAKLWYRPELEYRRPSLLTSSSP